MPYRTRWIVAAAWLVSLFAVGAWASAQQDSWTPLPEPVVLTGSDLGFRVDGMSRDGRFGVVPTGRLVIRLNGDWVEADPRGIPPHVWVSPDLPTQRPPTPR